MSSDLVLRGYQSAGIDGLRAGFADGHKAQVLYLPTGGGKTETAIALMKAANDRGTRSAMVLDRIVLCDQTSARLDRYKIPHGVMQSGHWRFRPYERIQICSAQTLEKRGDFPGIELLIVDECHNTRKQTIEFIKNNPKIKVVGLSASPFTKGLGAVYTNVVNTATTELLVEQGNLVPLRVFVSKQIDMEGAKKIAGEWSEKEATERGIQITGDIVAEWVSKTTSIYGGPRKTICFCAGVAHGEDLARKFAEAGFNFVSISYKDDDDFKRQAIEEFSKPDSSIHGLIATDILTKGFDLPDVMVGISARPFSKSLSSHVQQLGRVMRASAGKEFALWLCLARGSRVLTDSGLVPIEKVTLSHRIWDGTNFVAHGGAVCNGIQRTITYQGLTATPGHLVHTTQGWRTFGDCAREQIAITQTGLGRQAIRLREDHQPRRAMAGRKDSTLRACGLRVRQVWQSVCDFVAQLGRRAHERVQAVQSACTGIPNVAVCTGAGNAGALSQSEGRQLPALRGSRRGVPVRGRESRDAVDHGEPGYPAESRGNAFGSHQTGWALRAGQHPLADGGAQPVEQARQSGGGTDAQVPAGAPGNLLLGQHSQATVLERNDGCASHREIPSTLIETEREVWDILDAGPNNRFTCEGLLVHNCHSGNYVRFLSDWEEIYSDGPGKLDDGREKPKPEPTEREKKAAVCPKCGAAFAPHADTCAHCGYQRTRHNGVIVLPGEMEELAKREVAARATRQQFWSELNGICIERGYRPGWAFHKFREKFGVDPKGLSGEPAQPSFATLKWVQSQQIRWAKSARRAA